MIDCGELWLIVMLKEMVPSLLFKAINLSMKNPDATGDSPSAVKRLSGSCINSQQSQPNQKY